MVPVSRKLLTCPAALGLRQTVAWLPFVELGAVLADCQRVDGGFLHLAVQCETGSVPPEESAAFAGVGSPVAASALPSKSKRSESTHPAPPGELVRGQAIGLQNNLPSGNAGWPATLTLPGAKRRPGPPLRTAGGLPPSPPLRPPPPERVLGLIDTTSKVSAFSSFCALAWLKQTASKVTVALASDVIAPSPCGGTSAAPFQPPSHLPGSGPPLPPDGPSAVSRGLRSIASRSSTKRRCASVREMAASKMLALLIRLTQRSAFFRSRR